ncbi:MAG TPA: hypothetical protein VIE66_19755 [Methylocella sp.]
MAGRCHRSEPFRRQIFVLVNAFDDLAPFHGVEFLAIPAFGARIML